MRSPEIISDLISLIFPDLCAACERPLITGEKLVCLNCQLTLPFSNYHKFRDNPIEQHFWGKTKVESATALFHFIKSSRVQHLIHQLKYKGLTEIGLYCGALLGDKLSNAVGFADLDGVTSIPLHKAKQEKRGYNQSDFICEGVSQIMNIPFHRNLIARTVNTQTQTKKKRMERWKNVENIFAITDISLVTNKHILIVDDVITTGSTIESCANEILKIPRTRVSVAALAHVKH